MSPLLAQLESHQVVAGSIIAGSVFLMSKAFDFYGQYRENQDRKTMREHLVSQTEVLRSMHDEQIAVREILTGSSTSMAVALDRQAVVARAIAHIDKGVTQLKLEAGIPDTAT